MMPKSKTDGRKLLLMGSSAFKAKEPPVEVEGSYPFTSTSL